MNRRAGSLSEAPKREETGAGHQDELRGLIPAGRATQKCRDDYGPWGPVLGDCGEVAGVRVPSLIAPGYPVGRLVGADVIIVKSYGPSVYDDYFYTELRDMISPAAGMEISG
ncbi:hypothetical protein NDU88_008453 [Pleurodeles waltl]|uniref:Uncharacterized protein n=1 Tax=Pleurodeles waltl TaxID=8319 RepID=A0AAV7PS65_PLEWA|nr:hypothetical protein NDU88_008453 [Pleurodeles waltl]